MECHVDSFTYFLGLFGAGSMLWFMSTYLTMQMNDALSVKLVELEEALQNAKNEILSMQTKPSDEEDTD